MYTAESLALARSEMARHVNLEVIPDGFRVYEIEIPDEEYEEIKQLPKDWSTDPEPESANRLGDRYLTNVKSLACKVPSICDPLRYNYLLNPKCHRYSEVRIVKDYPFKH